jgi:hypothetical protein
LAGEGHAEHGAERALRVGVDGEHRAAGEGQGNRAMAAVRAVLPTPPLCAATVILIGSMAVDGNRSTVHRLRLRRGLGPRGSRFAGRRRTRRVKKTGR